MIETLRSTPSTLLSLAKLAIPRGKSRSSSLHIPEHGLRLKSIPLDQALLSRYREVCEIEASSGVPVLFPQVLVSALQLALLSDRKFPLSLLGAIHRRNNITQYQKIDPYQSVDLEVKLGSKRVLEKGMEIDVLNTVEQSGVRVWESITTIYVRGVFSGAAEPAAESTTDMKNLQRESLEPVAQWHLSRHKGKQYARITGDFNPIHISKMAAKLFGFERDLIHGLCVFATALDRVEETSVKTMNHILEAGNTKIQVAVEFKGPNYLDSDLGLYSQVDEEGTRMDLYCADNERPTLQALVSYRSND